MWSDEAIYKSSDIYYGHAYIYKDAIQLVILLQPIHSSQSLQQSEEKKNSIFKQFKQC
jgi:hypothetical protein